MELHQLDPLRDPRWPAFVDRSPCSSIFHTPEWLSGLHRTYGYEPVVFTSAADGRSLDDGLLFCRVNSWMTGRRLVSLPFSDHCEVLVDDSAKLTAMLEWMKTRLEHEGRYIEIRPTRAMSPPPGYGASEEFVWHSIDLGRALEDVFGAFHKSHTQRAVRKAQRSGVDIEVGRSPALLKTFYALHAMTRRRHGMPVQPLVWFRNLMEILRDRLQIYVASYDSRPVAAILVVRHKQTMVYKYGCSDLTYSRYGATPALFWRAISDGKSAGCVDFDLGRSETSAVGLLAFKDHLGARRTALTYYRYRQQPGNGTRALQRAAERAFTHIPVSVRTHVGSALYRHFG